MSRSPETEEFDQTGLDMITVFAGQASLALRLAQARRPRHEAAASPDHHR